MYEVEVEVQVKPDWAEVAQARETGDSEQSIDRSEDEAETPRPMGISAKAAKERDDAAEKMKNVVRGRKREIEHFVAKESGDPDNDQYEAAENYIS